MIDCSLNTGIGADDISVTETDLIQANETAFLLGTNPIGSFIGDGKLGVDVSDLNGVKLGMVAKLASDMESVGFSVRNIDVDKEGLVKNVYL